MIIGDFSTHGIGDENNLGISRGIFMNQPVEWNNKGVLNTAQVWLDHGKH